MRKRMLMWLCCGFIVVVLGAGCGRAQENTSAGAQQGGTISVSGAWALYPLMVQWGDAFQSQYPEVQMDISAGGAGKGMADALADAVDIGMVSREIYPQEIEKGAFFIPVAKDAVFLTVNAQNPVWEQLQIQGVSQSDLAKIFLHGEITTWGQLVNDPSRPELIHIFTRSDAAGAPATWAAFLGGTQEDLLGVGVYGDPGLLQAVIQDPIGIGYNNLNYAFDPATGEPVAGAHVVSIDVDQNGQVDAAERCETKAQAVASVASGVYPSPPARDLFLVTKGKPSGLVQDFLVWILTEGQVFVGDVGYVPLAPEKLAQGLKDLQSP